jgi:hypothetical protein
MYNVRVFRFVTTNPSLPHRKGYMPIKMGERQKKRKEKQEPLQVPGWLNLLKGKKFQSFQGFVASFLAPSLQRQQRLKGARLASVG